MSLMDQPNDIVRQGIEQFKKNGPCLKEEAPQENSCGLIETSLFEEGKTESENAKQSIVTNDTNESNECIPNEPNENQEREGNASKIDPDIDCEEIKQSDLIDSDTRKKSDDLMQNAPIKHLSHPLTINHPTSQSSSCYPYPNSQYNQQNNYQGGSKQNVYSSQNLLINENTQITPNSANRPSPIGSQYPQINVKEFRKIQECKPKLDKLSSPKVVLSRRKIQSLIAIPFNGQSYPIPHPPNATQLKDAWDNNHVKMPYSKRNGNEWQEIKSVLRNGFYSADHLEKSIKKYNKSYSNNNFNVLAQFFRQYGWTKFEKTLKSMADLALKLPHIVTKSVPLLKQRDNTILFISQYQIACLLANAFFCTFPRRSRKNAEYTNYPTFNFIRLFSSERDQNEMKIKIEKLKCFFSYFDKVIENKPNGVVTFERRSYQNMPKIHWEISDHPLTGLEVKKGTIEYEGRGYTEIDFANKYIGGGVLNSGCAQEEIRFLMCPELIVSRLFTEMLLDSETMVITGCKQYSIIKGYSNNFEFVGDYVNNLQQDEWRRHINQIVAMDSSEFQKKNDPNQFENKSVMRTLNKAYCGFYDDNSYLTGMKPAIASGKWGCGAFNGDPYLVCLLQLLAASQVNRNLILFIQKDETFKNEIEFFYKFVTQKNLTIRDILNLISSYNRSPWQVKSKNIFEYIMSI